MNLLHQVTFLTLSDASVKPDPKTHVNWTLNVLAVQVDWNALPLVGSVGEQNANINEIVSNDDDRHEKFECDDENMLEYIFGLWWLSIYKTFQ